MKKFNLMLIFLVCNVIITSCKSRTPEDIGDPIFVFLHLTDSQTNKRLQDYENFDPEHVFLIVKESISPWKVDYFYDENGRLILGPLQIVGVEAGIADSYTRNPAKEYKWDKDLELGIGKIFKINSSKICTRSCDHFHSIIEIYIDDQLIYFKDFRDDPELMTELLTNNVDPRTETPVVFDFAIDLESKFGY